MEQIKKRKPLWVVVFTRPDHDWVSPNVLVLADSSKEALEKAEAQCPQLNPDWEYEACAREFGESVRFKLTPLFKEIDHPGVKE